jgi:hypothetical protein
MKNLTFTGFMACGLFFIMISCSKADRPKTSMLDTVEYKNNLKILSEDSMQGRLPGTEGGTRAANYIASQFKKCGLTPISNEGYFQQVNIYSYHPDYKKTSIVISGKNFKEKIAPFDEVVFTSKQDGKFIHIESDMVFVGYGIVAPEYNWDDYKDADVNNKIVVCLLNHPDFKSHDFKKGQTTFYGTFNSRSETAFRKGAKGIVFIIQKDCIFPFPGWQNFIKNLSFGDYSLDSKTDLVSFIKEETFDRVLRHLKINTENLVKKANDKFFHPYSMSLQIIASFEQTTNKFTSPNIAGYVKGTEFPDQAVIYMAHYDHLGALRPIKGDSIYNGAIDNASGTSGIISLAKYFSTHPQKRTIIFLATTAEETGFQGVHHYIMNPLIPLDKTIAGINLDMMNFMGRNDSIELKTIAFTDAVEPLKQLAKNENLGLKLSKTDNEYLTFRVESYPFALHDVLVMDLIFEQIPKKYISLSDDQLKAIINEGGLNYHTPFDEIKPWFSYDGILQELELAKQIGIYYANDGIKPRFNSDNPYLPARKMWIK